MATTESHPNNVIGSRPLPDSRSGQSRESRLKSADGDGSPVPLAGESVLASAERALELVARRADLAEILQVLCDGIDALDSGATATVLLTGLAGGDGHLVAGRRVSRERMHGLTGLVSALSRHGGEVGGAGQAAVFIPDLASGAIWPLPSLPEYREFARSHGLRSAWWKPIVSNDRAVLGGFAVFSTGPHHEAASEPALLRFAAHLALIAIESERLRPARVDAVESTQMAEDSGLALRQKEQELRGVIDALPQHIAIFEPGGLPVYVNRSMLDYIGLTFEEMKATEFRSRIFHAEDLKRLRQKQAEAFAADLPFESELRILGKDDRYRWFLVRFSPLHDEAGHASRWYATGTDIDDRRQAEENTRNENMALREEIDRCSMFEEIIGSSAGLRRVLAHVEKVARADSTVLISGETGTGKELIARAIHRQSTRAAKPFIRVNCAAIPPSLIASELFGHEKGAFTGAMQRRLGRFEAVQGGTILLDEVGDLPAEAQIALLRVLQEREIERVGSNHPITVDVRVLAATNRDLDAAVERGSFRRDLYYRLNVFPIRVPSLRERVDDIPLLVEYLVNRYARKAGKKIRTIGKSTLDLLQAYHWPGNIRELQNVVERAVVLCEGENFLIDDAWLTTTAGGTPLAGVRLADSDRETEQREREMIEAALTECRGQIAGPTGAAAKLGVPRQTLDGKIKSLQIDKYRFRAAAPGKQKGFGSAGHAESA